METINAKHPELSGYKWEIDGDGLDSTGMLLDSKGYICAEFDNQIFTYKVFGQPPFSDISRLTPYDTISLEYLERQVTDRISQIKQDGRSDELLSRSNNLEKELNAAEAKIAELEARCAELESKNQQTKAAETAKNRNHDKPRPVREELEKAIQEAKSNTGQQQNKSTRAQDNYERW